LLARQGSGVAEFLEQAARGNGHDGGQGRGRAAANHPELGPIPKKGPQFSIGLAQIDIVAAGVRHHRGQLGQRQRAAKIHQAAADPESQNQRDIFFRFGVVGTGRQKAHRQDLGLEENAGANGAAHDDRGGRKQSQYRAESLFFGGLTLGCGGHGTSITVCPIGLNCKTPFATPLQNRLGDHANRGYHQRQAIRP
jgi:hypothetical protein